ncbi:Uma2 family endonuclease [Actinomadura barringtoniae]|uniref:Uma2 family endonuclease n=1 Tax=Actinomadura barringtoniae TaxID=1427535 RepID=A0A939PI98_9ACTN|nr:Uma2 family endonuclease [Actinomadura barringtoniae]MBO2450314.1 Uma2 family endonuclease [Actinomadura barringtoniae]
MREESPNVSTATEITGVVQLPDTAYNMWVRGELDDFVHAPQDHRVEVIRGKVVVSPPPLFEHDAITDDIVEAMVMARAAQPDFPWKTSNGAGLSLVGIGDGYIPDLMVLDREIYEAARSARVKTLVPDQVELVVEATSPGNARNDRRPDRESQGHSKWNGYAVAEIPYYLLIDRSPKFARSTLYSIPEQGSAAYLHEESWAFGETVCLPDPFGIEIDTSKWRPWDG